MYAISSSYTLLYLTIVFPVCWVLSSFLLVVLLSSRQLMYIMAGVLTTLTLDACCACYKTMHAA
jgi:hypothetical protein